MNDFYETLPKINQHHWWLLDANANETHDDED